MRNSGDEREISRILEKFHKLGANKSNIFVDEFFLKKEKKKKRTHQRWRINRLGVGDGENLEQKSKK